MFHSVGFHFICRRRKNKADHYSSRIVFDVKEVFMLYSENIQYHIKRKFSFSFGHCPNHLSPNSGNFVLFREIYQQPKQSKAFWKK